MSETTQYQINFYNKIKLKIYNLIKPFLIKFEKLIPFFTFESILIYYFFLVVIFGRSFTGILIFGFRVGELMIGSALVLFTYFVLFKNKKITNLLGKEINITLKIFLLSFFIMNFFNGGITNFLNPETYRSSSYIWSIGFLFALVFLRKLHIFDSNLFLTAMFISLPLTYLLTSVYYPNIISDFFTNYSDKMRMLKGSDLFMIYSIYCLLFFERIKNNNFIYIFTFILSGTLIPLIVFSSRGASIGTFIVLIYSVVSNRKAFLRNKLVFIVSTLAFLVSLTLSSIYLDWTEIDFEELNTEMAIDSLEMTLVSKRYPETTKPYFYIENNRINSGDGNLNWRLQIWQDVIQDLNDKNSIMLGYGFQDEIPAMQRIDRAGLDGTNIHVHNYFINVLARGGLFHLLIIMFFYIFIIFRIKKLENKLGVVFFILAVMFVSFFDSSMETVRYPFLFFTVLSYKLLKK